EGRYEHLDARHLAALERLNDRRQQLPLRLGQRRVQELREQLLPRSVPEAPRERLGVALGRGRVRERAGVLVNAEREGRRLERGDRELALREDADERGRERPVLGDDGVLGTGPLGRLGGMVVEDDLLDRR